MRLTRILCLLCLFVMPVQLPAAELSEADQKVFDSAMERQDLKAMKPFLSKGVNLDKALFRSIELINVDMLKLLVEHGANVNARTVTGDTPLHAVAWLNLFRVEDLQSGNARTSEAYTKAIKDRANRMEMLDFLVERGADINALNQYHETPIYRAFHGEQPLVGDYFIAKKADPSVGLNLFQSESMAHLDTNYLRYLLEYGYRATPDADDISTPLHQLIQGSGDAEKIKLLIEFGADINAPNKDGLLPLVSSLSPYRSGPENLTDTLISLGATITPEFAQAKFREAIVHRDTIAAEKIIATTPEVVNGIDQDGLTPLMLASRGSLKFVRILLNHSAELNTRSNGLNALDEAMQFNYDYIAKYLIKQGIDVNVYADDNKEKPLRSPALTMAITRGSIEMSTLLLENQATTNFDGPANVSPLWLATQNGDLPSVKLLIEHGADSSIKTERGTLREIALANDHLELAEFLKAQGVE